MVLVRILKNTADGMRKGEVCDVSPEVAGALLVSRHAELVRPEVATTEVRAPEQAVTRRRGR